MADWPQEQSDFSLYYDQDPWPSVGGSAILSSTTAYVLDNWSYAYKTVDAGQTWTQCGYGTDGPAWYDDNYTCHPLVMVDENVGYACDGQSHCLFKTTDGWETDTEGNLVEIPLTYNGSTSVIPWSLHVFGTTIWVQCSYNAGGGRDLVYRSTNDGSSFSNVTPPNVPTEGSYNIGGFWPVSSTACYCLWGEWTDSVFHQNLEYTSNGGSSWTSVWDNEDDTSVVMQYVAVSADDIVMVAKQDGWGDCVYSHDGGQNWSSSSLGAEFFIWCLTAADGNFWYGDEDGKIRHSSDGGETWATIYHFDIQTGHEHVGNVEANSGIVIAGNGGYGDDLWLVWGQASTWDCSILINDDDATTTTKIVHLDMTAAFGVESADEMCFSQDGGVTWSDWEPFAATRGYTLANGANGTRRVYARFRMT